MFSRYAFRTATDRIFVLNTVCYEGNSKLRTRTVPREVVSPYRRTLGRCGSLLPSNPCTSQENIALRRLLSRALERYLAPKKTLPPQEPYMYSGPMPRFLRWS